MTAAATALAPAPATFVRRISGQAAMLLAAFGIGQALSLVRNAVLGHWLSKGDFGIAASITLILQFTEILSDVGVDRHVVQSTDGDDPGVQACAHTLLVARGFITSASIFLLAHPIAAFFRIEEAVWAFQIAALTPFLRGLGHLDARRLQRHYDNRAFVALEIVPQAAALALMLPALFILKDYGAVVAALLSQAVVFTALSWALAERPYRLRLDADVFRRILVFGWPIWLSAFPLVGVFQGERLIVGRLLGIEALAAFTVVFMATMVPGLAAAKIANSLMLPLLSSARAQPGRYLSLVRTMSEATSLLAAVYASFFFIAGGRLIPLVFGPAYHGLEGLAACLGLMWAVRMLQVVPGMSLMSVGRTRPLLVAGCIRAFALPFALLLATQGASLSAVASTGIAGELASLAYMSVAAECAAPGAGRAVLSRSLFLLPACTLAGTIALLTPASAGAVVVLASFTGLTSALAMGALAVMPCLAGHVRLRAGHPFRRLLSLSRPVPPEIR